MSVVLVLKGLVEFAGLLLIAQGLVFVVSFGRHELNPIYRGLRFLASPVTRVTRLITPRFIVDSHVPAVSVFVLICAWIALVVAKAVLLGGAH